MSKSPEDILEIPVVAVTETPKLSFFFPNVGEGIAIMASSVQEAEAEAAKYNS